jgi:hypothetical protein
MLLTRTNAMLSSLDHAMAASGTPPASTTTNGNPPAVSGVPPLNSILNPDQALASFMALASAASVAQAANAQVAANTQVAANAQAVVNASPAPPPVLPPPHHYHQHGPQLPPFGRSYPYPSQSGGDSPPQRIPTPPARGL